jgi:hypothetical protein
MYARRPEQPRPTIWVAGLQVEGPKRALGARGRGSCDRLDAGVHLSARRSPSFVAGCRRRWRRPTEQSRPYSTEAPAPPAAAIQSTIVIHGTEWTRGNDELPVNGPIQYRPWALRTPTGETLSAAEGIGERSALDLFLLMFRPLHVQ